jgi:Bacterial Ig-like domain (group 3)/RTX calcium-binding nonapeptide repeat (4 copies)
MFEFSPVRKWLRGSGQRRATVRKPPRPRLALEALDERILLSVTSTFSAATGVLTVAGDSLDNTIVVSRDAAGTILMNNGAVAIQGGQATVANTSKILVTGGAGNDVLTMDETNGGLPQATLDGGAGNDVLTGGAVALAPGLVSSFDTLLGGAGDDTLFGGASAEFINGGTGNDTLFGGAGDDRFSWNPGDGNDTVDGQAGNDSPGFFGDSSNENIALSADGTQARLTRDVDGVTMGLNSLEVVNVLAQGGADTITVNDLTGTGVIGVSLFLGDTGNGGDGQADTVIVNGTNGNDNVSIIGSTVGGASLYVVGLPAQVGIFQTETIDHLTVNTLGGFDRVDASGLDTGVIGLTVDLGDGQAAGVTTTTTLSTSTATAVFGQPVTLTATVNSAAGVPTGFVTFRAGTTVLGTALVDANGQATLTTLLGVGNATLTASFTGTGNFANSTSAAVALTVTRAATAVSLASSVNPAATGQSVTFTATVSVLAPGVGTPTGTVTFRDGNVVLGTAAVVPFAGTARFTTSFAAAGGHAITAVYSGDASFVGSSQTLTEQVNAATTPQATTTALTASANPAVVGQAVTFTATVRGPAGTGTPTGTVTFRDGGVVLGTVAVGSDGTARLATSFATAGGHAITAAYSGDANFAASSQALTEQVNAPATPQATTTALAASINPARMGQTVTFTATVRGPAGPAPPTGTVSFFVGNTLVARVTLDANGQARLRGAFWSRGLFTIRAVYSGDANFAASSQSLTEQVI